MKKSLFDKVCIGSIEFKNRFVRSATWEGMCDVDGRVTPRLIDFYRELAEGGCSLIISGYSYVRADGRQMPGKMGIDKDDLVPGLKELTAAVHNSGSKVFCQLVHAGGQTTSKMIGKKPLAPSATDYAGFGEEIEELSVDEIAAIVAAFGKAATRAKAAGFDGVQLHGAHGYLINQFLSPVINRRTDEYGGSVENRMRFLEEVCRVVRSAVGANYPVTIKLTGADHLANGFTIEEAIIVSQRLEALGIDAIEVSSGTPASGGDNPARTKIDSPDKEGYNAELAGRIKQTVAIPVITVGGLRSARTMQDLLEQGKADLFALSRPLIREPDLPRKIMADPDYVATCISCNGCFRPGTQEGGIYCVIDRKVAAST